ncbi:MAG: CDP-alcohol phosphatidyltransferase family protein [Pseudomonadota bacterium]|nr:CDP-alcohol phosphatidyltransferase family protein [Pseudomonadota bacterium]
MITKPWDSRIALTLVRPLRHSRLTPNHITTLSLAAGLGAGALFALGGPAAHGGAVLYMLAALLDHADGEFARLTGKTSLFGHRYDQAAGAISYVALFAGIGIGLRDELGGWGLPLGIIAGVAVTLITTLRFELERRAGRNAIGQPTVAGFEIEDILYLIGPVTWLGGLPPFLVAAGIGAPLFAVWVVWEYRRKSAAAAGGTARP